MASSEQTRLPPEKVDCRWWKRGYCFRGTKCFFKHNPALIGVDAPKPHSENEKEERVIQQQDNTSPDSQTKKASQRRLYKPPREPCGICYETPEVYGLLTQCDHVFCLDCIREWRSSSRKTTPAGSTQHIDSELVQMTKTCPVCRIKSDFVVPSCVMPSPLPKGKSVGSSSGGTSPSNPAKKELVDNYLQQRKRIPCKFYQASVRKWRALQRKSDRSANALRFIYTDDDEEDEKSDSRSAFEGAKRIPFKPRCKFGNDCHYAHTHPMTGEPHIFTQSELEHMQSRFRQRRSYFISDRLLNDSLAIWDMFHDEGARHIIESVNHERRQRSLSPLVLTVHYEGESQDTNVHSFTNIDDWDAYSGIDAGEHWDHEWW
ncbi:hypothetical protein KEM54_004939 [Ascosphaera aggregata]|nr:hypothetical protein KEM54_004939 [Ascosphaera aggregata]